jgi:two-component system response regulator RstA
MQPSILLVEDDRKLTELVTEFMQRHGFTLHVLHNGAEAPARIQALQPDLVVLDLMLPGLDGLGICRAIRSRYAGKILMLTASEDDMDQVAALELGVDDFVSKPLHPRVLLARIRMLLRRDATSSSASDNGDRSNQPHLLHFGSLTLDARLQRCTLAGEPVNLTPGEFELLWLLANHLDGPMSRDDLVRETRGIEYDGIDRTIDNKVASLRRKLDDNASLPEKIITVRGKGYLFVPDIW